MKVRIELIGPAETHPADDLGIVGGVFSLVEQGGECFAGLAASTLAHDGDDQRAAVWVGSMLPQKDPLPGSERRGPLSDRDR